jgi:outer membrane protein assembly factor BamB
MVTMAPSVVWAWDSGELSGVVRMISGRCINGLAEPRRAQQARFGTALFLAISLVGLCAVNIASGQETPGPNDHVGFSVHKAPQDVLDSLSDFERYRDKKVWSKAFTSLEKVFNIDPGTLLPDKDGLFIPTDTKACAELLSLSPEGREAYRLFNDPKAQQLLDSATSIAADATGKSPVAQLPADDVMALRRIVERYFITSVGDKAADRLGDALFESGDFAAAEHFWRMILESYPDSGLSAPLLQTKRGIALARAAEWDDFKSVRALVAQRYAGQLVPIGGKDVDAGQFLDAMAAKAPAATSPSVTPGDRMQPSTIVDGKMPAQPISLPASKTPAWQIPLIDQAISERIHQQLNQIGWGGMAGQLTDNIPRATADDKRLYVNWIGSCFAVDLVTGKMVWRTNPMFQFDQNFQQMVMQGQVSSMAGGNIQVIGSRLLVVKAEMRNPQNGQSAPARLLCLATDTGKTLWATKEDPDSNSAWSYVGKPIVKDDSVYVCACQRTPALHLICLGLDKGDLRWDVELGNETTQPDFRGMQRPATPVLLADQKKLYILTNNAALLAVNLSTHQTEWAYSSEGVPVNPQQRFNPFQEGMGGGAETSGAMLLSGSTLYFKETGSDRLYAMDVSIPSLKWKRPIDSNVALVAGNNHSLLFLGPEVDCINCDSREMLWSNALGETSAANAPLLGGDQLFVFDPRGVQAVRTDTGDSGALFHGYDQDSLGGDLAITSDRLITLSSHAITAYAVIRKAQP